MRSSVLSGAAVVLGAAQLINAQTYTSCNPTKNSSCPADPALGKTINIDFTAGGSDDFTQADGTHLRYDTEYGALFNMSKETDAPTITSNDYIMFGRVDVVMRASPGQGVISSVVLESDDLDEIDWEWIGGYTYNVETNYFGKGNTTSYDRALYYNVTEPQNQFHNYSIDWTKDYVRWSIDEVQVRQLNYSDALDGKNFPQTPMRIKLGSWDGGASTESTGTIEWAGGLTNFTDAPFQMWVKTITIADYGHGGNEYVYTDLTGDYQSIKAQNGTEDAANILSGSTSGTSTKSSNTTSSTGSSASASSSSSAGHKFGVADGVVIALGLVMGYFFM